MMSLYRLQSTISIPLPTSRTYNNQISIVVTSLSTQRGEIKADRKTWYHPASASHTQHSNELAALGWFGACIPHKWHLLRLKPFLG